MYKYKWVLHYLLLLHHDRKQVVSHSFCTAHKHDEHVRPCVTACACVHAQSTLASTWLRFRALCRVGMHLPTMVMQPVPLAVARQQSNARPLTTAE